MLLFYFYFKVPAITAAKTYRPVDAEQFPIVYLVEDRDPDRSFHYLFSS